MPSVRTLLVEDFRSFREYVRSILQQQHDFTIIGEAADGLTAVRMASDLKPQLILLDIGLPKLHGFEAARRIRRVIPDCKILVLTQESAPEIVEEALALGAQGHVMKAHAHRDLLVAVNAVLKGELFLSRELSDSAKVDVPI